ncbi:AAA family ATPase [Anaerococcus porci]|uniref:ATP-binding protein n=1 Tax=Anaerococcus porci TaxID=2652269 RepID=UPI002A747CBD|nr:AAA family ATPase [Anaerococcus porci]MDY3005935.1 AAA family ATPase [Anaerococcus porci]
MINEELENKIKIFRDSYDIDPSVKDLIKKAKFPYVCEEVYKEAISSILAGKNLLLVGDKSTGKNVLAENLAYLFNRPLWTSSFHINIDAYDLIGGDTLKNGKIIFRPGPIYKAAKYGGFGVLDEINMAKNEAIAVLHEILDYRRMLEIPGYENLKLHPATRFIATMNYDYEGTRDLNEALLSRFVIIQMPIIKKDDLKLLIKSQYKNMKDEYIDNFTSFFFDLRLKVENGELLTVSPDLRSLFDSFDLIKEGLNLKNALKLTVVNKSFDEFEKKLIEDLIMTRFKDRTYYKDVFNE